MKVTKKYDKPMSGIDVYSLDGLGCACTNKMPVATSSDPQKQRLLTLRRNIIDNPSAFSNELDPANTLNAIDYLLKHWDNPVLRDKAISVLNEQAHKIYKTSLGSTRDDLLNNSASAGAEKIIPGSGKVLDALGIKASTFDPISKIASLFSSGPSNANNAAQRAVLDKFTIPSDFDLIKYATDWPEVVDWANKQGLNSPEYVQKQIAWHWFAHGKAANWPYPYKPGMNPNQPVTQLPASGTFDWIGGQDNNTRTAFHIGPNNLQPGDSFKVTVTNGDTRYSGIHKVVYKGVDDGSYQIDTVTVDYPRKVGGDNAIGTWEKVSSGSSSNSIMNTISSTSNTTKAVIGLAAVGVIAGIIYLRR